jgi:hypothetical protein
MSFELKGCNLDIDPGIDFVHRRYFSDLSNSIKFKSYVKNLNNLFTKSKTGQAKT